jgi:DNA-binding CsgD family transcriptional regulator
MLRFLFAYCFLPLVPLCGQEVPRIRNFPPTEYAAQNQNWALAQHPAEGWLYAANNGGLLEFDGARWQQYALPEGQTVRAVAVGPDGAVYCGGFAEFGYWLPDAQGRLTYTSLSAQVKDDRLEREEIWNIVVTSGAVLFQSFSTIYKFDFQKIATLRPPNSIMFAREVEGRILLPVIGQGVYELLADNTFRILPGSEKLSGEIVQFLVPDGSGGVWAGTTDHGIFELRDGQCRPWPHPINADFRRYQLNKAVALSGGGWAIGTILNGVYILDSSGQLRYLLRRENGLQNNTVLALAEDRDGNLWLGLDRGLDFVALRSPLTFFTDQTGKIGTTYAAALHERRLYLGTNQGVFRSEAEVWSLEFEVRSLKSRTRQPELQTSNSKLQTSNSELQTSNSKLQTSNSELQTSNSELQTSNFHLVEGTQGQVWDLQVLGGQLLCGHNSGTFLIRQGLAQKISDLTGGWQLVPVPRRPGLLLQSTYTGLVVFDQNPAGSWRSGWRVQGFDQSLKKIVWDSSGYLWGSHAQKGLYRLRLSDDLRQVTEWRVFGRADGLPTDYHLDVESENGTVVLNARPNIYSIRTEGGKSRFLPNDSLSGVRKWMRGYDGTRFLLDSNGLWMRRGGQTVPLRLHLVPNFERVVPLSDLTYLFCLENGYARLDSRRFFTAPVFGTATLRSIETLDSQYFKPENGLVFPYRQNSLRFRFALPAFEHAPRFSWRLDGFTKHWSAWQTAPEREFASLPAGRYTFRVRAEGVAGEAAVEFRIDPPWYASAWALGAYGLLLAAMFWAVEVFNRRRLLRQRERLEADNARELARQRAEAEREKLLLEVENQSRELSNAAFNLIRKNEAMLSLKDELLGAKLGAHTEPRALQKIVRHIDQHLESDHDWALFEESFNRVHDDFFKRLMQQFPELTPGDLRLAAYLKMNLSSKEIAPLLNISVRGVENKRYRLRKKLGLSEEANLAEFILGY